MKQTFLVGIDEAGRGPLAGPVAVGVVVVPRDFDWVLVAGAKDSKQLSEKKREEIYARLVSLQREGVLDFAVAFSSAALIDRRGIVFSIDSAIARALKKVCAQPHECEVRLDGSLHAPETFTHQKTIIRGDASEPVISLASIAAKVLRDRLMVRMARMYPQYAFDVHKGYGTRAHIDALAKHGLCEIHRASFCRRLPIAEISV